MENKNVIINLEFTGTVSRIAGNSFGRRIYEEQVKNNIDYQKHNIIIFPTYIKDIGMSFVKGFTEEMFDKLTLDEFNEIFEIRGVDKVVDKFMRAILI